MKILWIILVLISTNLYANKDEYVLPQDIIDARDKVIESKRALDRSIFKRYRDLCLSKKALNDAEYIELLAYREITSVECYEIPFVRLR